MSPEQHTDNHTFEVLIDDQKVIINPNKKDELSNLVLDTIGQAHADLRSMERSVHFKPSGRRRTKHESSQVRKEVQPKIEELRRQLKVLHGEKSLPAIHTVKHKDGNVVGLGFKNSLVSS